MPSKNVRASLALFVEPHGAAVLFHFSYFRVEFESFPKSHYQIKTVFTTLSFLVPLAPELHLEPLNCTTIIVRWQLAPRNSVSVLGYRLFYHEESQLESAPIQLRALDNTRTIGGLSKYCFRVTSCLCGTQSEHIMHYFLLYLFFD